MTAIEAPWDTSPASDAQCSYYRELVIVLGNNDPESHDTTMVSEAIRGLNIARKALGIPFREFGV